MGVLVELLLSGTGASFALESLRGAVNTGNAEHLKVFQILDMDIFRKAVEPESPLSASIYKRAMLGAVGLPDAAAITAAP